jgi:hypothetical protein
LKVDKEKSSHRSATQVSEDGFSQV